jgi:hypothetical protein
LDRLDSKWTTFPIKSLNLARNNLNQIPVDFLQKATQLAVLDLSQNHFGDMTDLINTFKSSATSSLKDLSLRGNSIQNVVSFPPSLGLLRLDMSENLITTLNADSFSNLATLNTLILKNNKINSISPQAFANNVNLNSLELSNNFLSTPPSIANLKSLNNLDLSNQNGQLVSLPDKAFDRLQVNDRNLNLNLRSNNIVQFGSQSFCTTSYTTTPSISTLQLSYASAVAVDKCLIKQMSQQSIQNTVTVAVQQEANADYTNVCGCNLKLFYNNFKIQLSDACNPSITGCNGQVTDDCVTKTQFTCPVFAESTTTKSTTSTGTSTYTTSTTITSPTITTPTITAGPTVTTIGTDTTVTTKPSIGTSNSISVTTINYNKNGASSIKADSLFGFFILSNLLIFYYF